jgi:hypothetical protein
MKFPVNSQLAGNFHFRDGFARDCLLSHHNPLLLWVFITLGDRRENGAVPGGLRHALRRGWAGETKETRIECGTG